MQDALVFGEQNSLDFSEIRFSVIRIPEVSLRLEEAQKIWDEGCGSSFSFQHFLSSDDSAFFNNINLKSLSLAVVQLGLLDRFTRLFQQPAYLIGNTQNDSALLVAAGKMTFKELIVNSPACPLLRPMSPLHVATELVLKGRMLPQYQVFKRNAAGDLSYNMTGKSDMDLRSVLQQLVDDGDVRRLIHIGPGLFDRAKGFGEYELRDLQILESIDIDPMLGWFWTNLKKHEFIGERAQ